jgi:hypothetical protein
MEVKQVQFRTDTDTVESQKLNGGIAIYDYANHELQYVICGCCGGIFMPDEIASIRALEWISLTDEIVGN